MLRSLPQVSGLELSLVDGRPQELLVLSLEGLSAEYHAGSTAGVAYVQTSLKLRNLQVGACIWMCCCVFFSHSLCWVAGVPADGAP